jgi:LmbE family N-acetylglucosaminyl deacetylase
LAAKLGPAETCPEIRRRAALAAACLAGISIFRNVLCDSSLVEEDAPELAEAIRRILDCALRPAATLESGRKG